MRRIMDINIIKRGINYFQNTIFFWDRIERGYNTNNLSKEQNETERRTIKIGWCSVFPPIPNGVAVMTKSIVKEIVKRKKEGIYKEYNIELYAIPIINKIDKSKFPEIKFAKIDDPLDVIFFFCSHDQIKFANKKTKKIAWQTLHFLFEEKSTEKELFEEIKKADTIVGMTKMARDEYTKNLTAGNEKTNATSVAYIPGGIDPKNHNWRKEKKKKVIFVSRSMYYKGLAPFLDAVPFIVEKHPDVEIFAHMTLDTNALYFDELMNTAKKRTEEFPQNFSYSTAWLSEEEMRNLYDESSVLIFPSNNEGFGIPLIEAMASGTLCIVGDKLPMNEIIEHEVTGFCLPIKKQEKYHDFVFPVAKDMANLCNRILKNPQEYEEIKKNAREKVVSEYNIKKVTSQLLQCAVDSVDNTSN
jgi:glycosyltransferase involved in cell wall biosynthesis